MKSWNKADDTWRESKTLEVFDVFMLSIFGHLFSVRVPHNAAAKMWKWFPTTLKAMHRFHWRMCVRNSIRKVRINTVEALNRHIADIRFERIEKKYGSLATAWAAEMPAAMWKSIVAMSALDKIRAA